jgi:hypothetical protein
MDLEPMTDRSRIGKSNVRKGKTLERRVAHLFSDYTGQEFRRRRVEGRDASVIERESTADVIPVRGDILFSIEVKSGQFGSIDALLANPLNTMLTKWWHQACYDATLMTELFKKDYYPLLFFKFNRNADWIAISKRAFDHIKLSKNVPFLDFDHFETCGRVTHNVSHTDNRANEVQVSLSLDAIRFMRWQDFCEAVDPKSIFR